MRNGSNSPFLESNHIDSLKRVGLSENEIRVYGSLLKNRDVKTGVLMNDTGIGSSAIYASLSELIRQGFVSYQVRNNIRYYRAEPPNKLVDTLKQETSSLQELGEMVLRAQSADSQRNPANLYEGMYGFKRAQEEFISHVEPGETITIFSYGKDFAKDTALRTFFKESDEELLKKGSSARVLMDKSVIPTFLKDRKGMDIYELRSLPSKYFGLWGLSTSKKEATISIMVKPYLVFKISNPVMVEGFRKNFDVLWEGAMKLDR